MTNQPAPEKCCPRCGSYNKQSPLFPCNVSHDLDPWHDALPVEPHTCIQFDKYGLCVTCRATIPTLAYEGQIGIMPVPGEPQPMRTKNCEHSPTFSCGTYCTTYKAVETVPVVAPSRSIREITTLEKARMPAVEMRAGQKGRVSNPVPTIPEAPSAYREPEPVKDGYSPAQSTGVVPQGAERFVIVADGEGAEACVIADGDLHEAVHRFMCCCGKPWRECECGREMIQDIELIDDPDEWSRDEAGKPFSVSWPHETGKITIYKLSKAHAAASQAEHAEENTVTALRELLDEKGIANAELKAKIAQLEQGVNFWHTAHDGAEARRAHSERERDQAREALRIISELQTVKNGQYIVHAGAVMKHIAHDALQG